MAVTAKTLRLQQALRDQLLAVTNDQVRTLVTAWADAWDTLAPLLTAALVEQMRPDTDVKFDQLLKSTRLLKATAAVADALETLLDGARDLALADIKQVVDDAGSAQAAIVASQLWTAQDLVRLDSWSRVDPRQVEAIVSRTTQQITSRHRFLSDQAYAVVQSELIRGVSVGANPRDTAREMVRKAEDGFNGGLNRALVIARTETLDAHRNAAALAQALEEDVLAGWTWLAKMDSRTCRSCWAQHGKLHDLSELGPLDHPQGRCARCPKTKTWRELGFDGYDEPEDLMPDAEAEFDRLSSTEQVEILGLRGYTAWIQGKYPIEMWTQRQRNAGWRDSFTTTRAPEAQ